MIFAAPFDQSIHPVGTPVAFALSAKFGLALIDPVLVATEKFALTVVVRVAREEVNPVVVVEREEIFALAVVICPCRVVMFPSAVSRSVMIVVMEEVWEETVVLSDETEVLREVIAEVLVEMFAVLVTMVVSAVFKSV